MSEDIITPLSAQEKARLTELESIIKEHQYGFMVTGKALREIEQEGLYRPFGSMPKYLEMKWPTVFKGLTKRRMYQMIAAAEVAENLTNAGLDVLPTNEKQVRALTALKPEQQVEVWKDATTDGVVPTGNSVKDAVQKILGSSDEPLFSDSQGERLVKQDKVEKKSFKRERSRPVQGSVKINYRSQMLEFVMYQPAYNENMRAKEIPMEIPLDDLVALGFHVPTEEEHEV